ncbi:MAG TPA: hypothetical protein VMB04_09065 [Mycobacterium sp.]|nr:hypothetical protein [Mycobacterium sp.]
MFITHTPKRVVAAALLSGALTLVGIGLAAGDAQAQPGDKFAQPHEWCPGQPLPEADVHWDTNICHTWFWVPVAGMGNAGEFVWDGDTPPPLRSGAVVRVPHLVARSVATHGPNFATQRFFQLTPR